MTVRAASVVANGVVGFAVAAAIGFAAADASAQTKVTAGIAAYYEAMMPFELAVKRGFYQEEGIVQEPINFRGGSPAVQAFLGGSVDLCYCSFDHVVKLRNRGQDAVAILGVDEFHSYALIARADSPVTSFESLKGKKLGITASGSMTDITVRYDIKQLGLNADRDYQIIGAGSGALMKAALENGAVDAGMTIAAVAEDLMSMKGKYKIVREYRTMPYAGFVVIARGKWLKENPELARKYVRATVKAQKLIQSDPAVAEEMVKAMFPTFEPDLVKAVAASARSRLSKDGTLSEVSANNVVERIAFADPSVKPVPFAEAADMSFLPK